MNADGLEMEDMKWYEVTQVQLRFLSWVWCEQDPWDSNHENLIKMHIHLGAQSTDHFDITVPRDLNSSYGFVLGLN